MESLESKHEAVRDHLGRIEAWVEDMPITSSIDRRSVATQVVDFLQRYVVVDAEWEEKNLFPHLGDRAVALRCEHRYIARWVRELEVLTAASPLDAAQFRRLTYKLIGLLDAHMHAEEEALATLDRPEVITLVNGAEAALR